MTLIELLVGMVIVSVLLGVAMMAFPRTGERRTDLASEKAAALIGLLCERAELTGRDVGMGVQGSRLVFASLRADGWQPFADSPDEALRPRVLGEQLELQLRVDEVSSLAGGPDAAGFPVVCLASGEMTPFTLAIEGPTQRRWLVRGDATGQLSRTRSDVAAP
jgi:prepilin-type N-terminal cleavage/methylation domain-containing protein